MQAQIDEYVNEAREDGVQINGVTPRVISGRGIGMVATRQLEKDEAIMTIPTEAIRSLHTIPHDISMKLDPDMSIHGLLAAEVTLHNNPSHIWSQIIPTWEDFQNTVPLLWPEALQELLPAEAKSLLIKQKAKYEADWEAFRTGFPKQDRQNYLYAWFLVGTRTFFFDSPEMTLYPLHDRLSLLPVADLFNHSATGCEVSFQDEGYTITTDRHYDAGEEIFTSYGDHTNDFLLAEYGFVLEHNPWDKICLDDLIIPKLSATQISTLKEKGYSGEYLLHHGSKKNDAIFIALRVLCSDIFNWQKFEDGDEDMGSSLAEGIALLPELLNEYRDRIAEAKTKIRKLSDGKEAQKSLLWKRWEQIETIVEGLVETQW
ncbi:unnamed protein product [Clonostachys chloroleuca]|uniref:SET domain-containing protein n=1 Tax=Clonostachys chloroleuca TaxID=1926264 RepID=A0AA35PU67_9HYPO|nr:unnamed protein product [Clonostachys chloroleuca]